MRYIWTSFYRGVIRDLIAREGNLLVEVPDAPAVKLGSSGRSIGQVAKEGCEFREAYDVIFIHADTGGRSVEQRIAERADEYCAALAALCDWPCGRCITITPRHETEAWILADGEAITAALG